MEPFDQVFKLEPITAEVTFTSPVSANVEIKDVVLPAEPIDTDVIIVTVPSYKEPE